MGIEVTDERLFNRERDELRARVAELAAEVALLTTLLEGNLTNAMRSTPNETADSFALGAGYTTPRRSTDTVPPMIGTRDTELTARIAALEAALKACADDLEAYVNAEYPISLRDEDDSYERNYRRDIQPVVDARTALGDGQ